MPELSLELINDIQNQPRSCDQCRKRKIKCDFAKPRCQTCIRRDKACSYDDPVRKRGPKPRQLEEPGSQSNSNHPPTEGSYNSISSPIPISISFANGSPQNNCYDYGGQSPRNFTPGSFTSLNHTPTASFLNMFSPETSPSGSLQTAFRGLNIQATGVGSNDVYDQTSFSPLSYTPSNRHFHEYPDVLSGEHLSPISCSPFAHISQYSSRPQSPGACSSAFSPVHNFGELTELEVSLLNVYYQLVHPTFLLIPKDVTTNLSSLATDYSLQFLIYSMCAAAASIAPESHLAEHAPIFLSHAQSISRFVTNQTSDYFVWGSELLRLYFSESYYTYPTSH
ncbi:hypothetical protein DSO57_1021111 [Entomophthora muscae]|uniref:Uncharacterized protein n=1 Tax=Entomophthora muscae TaxID=34485 RepID=A0ACC2UQ57_9FUNG|nr:hypothetical protein DSO57_1021111 [Entomophthora muscae]